MMLKVRVIPCLDVKDGRVVKGVKFVELRDAGDPVEAAAAYDEAGADQVAQAWLESINPPGHLLAPDLSANALAVLERRYLRKDGETGEVVEFISAEIERIQHEIAEKHGFELLDHSLVLYVKAKDDKTED